MPFSKKLLFLFFFFCLAGSSCIDPITLNLEGEAENLVIEGTFTQQDGSHPLQLFYTINQDPNEKNLVSGASIHLVNSKKQQEAYQEIEPGIYELKGDKIKGEIGEEYYLEIQLPNGKQYESIPAVMPILVKGDSLSIDYTVREEEGNILGTIVKKPYILVDAHTSLPTSENNYWLKWGVTTMYSFPEVLCGPIPPPPKICFIPDTPSPSQIGILNGSRIEAGYLSNWRVGEKLLTPTDFEFRGRFYFLVNQQSVTQDTYNYWQKINTVANQRGSIFDVPPAAVPGNVFNIEDKEEIVLGYFEVSSTDSLRRYVTEADLRNDYRFTRRTCSNGFDPFARVDPVCCSCLSIDKSSLKRPSWW